MSFYHCFLNLSSIILSILFYIIAFLSIASFGFLPMIFISLVEKRNILIKFLMGFLGFLLACLFVTTVIYIGENFTNKDGFIILKQENHKLVLESNQ